MAGDEGAGAQRGFGAELLSHQDADGQWAGGPFFPAGFRGEGPRPWTATTWALKDLREWGVDAAVLAGTAEKLEPVRWEYEEMPYWGGEVDVCINSWTLSKGLWLGADVDGIVEWFLDHQLTDGGWNCEWVNGSTRSSFHSTLNALVGLLDYQRPYGGFRPSRRRTRGGEEYLLVRSLFKRASNGEPYSMNAFSLAHPRRAYYSILAAADYFRDAGLTDGTAPDPRLAEAIERIRARPTGRWNVVAGAPPSRRRVGPRRCPDGRAVEMGDGAGAAGPRLVGCGADADRVRVGIGRAHRVRLRNRRRPCRCRGTSPRTRPCCPCGR